MSRPDVTALSPATIVDFLGDIFDRRGAESYLGEDVTMSEHMLQGAQLAEQASAGDAIIAAALLHDIGHYTNEFPEDALAQGIDNKLSDASVHTLNLQGGPMDDAEVAEFAKNPNLDNILRVRIWDDLGKDPTVATPDFWHYAPILQRVVDAHTAP